MSPTLLLSAALVAPAAPIPACAPTGAPGPAPRVLALKADTSGAVRVMATIPTKVTVTNTQFVIEQVMVNGKAQQQQVQKQVEQDVVSSTYINKTLADFNGKFATADGTPLSLAEATARVKGGATLLASADGKPVGKQWLAAVAPDTVVMVAEGLEKVQQQWGGGVLPATPNPRLAMIGTDDTGKLIAQCTDNPLNQNGNVYYGDDIIFEGRIGRGGFGRGGIYYGGQQQYEGKVVNKPLADVPFEAYDRNGKLVPRTTALKRLAAGGMVLVAGNNVVPDENYLKAFKDDVLVLVGADLVLPVTPLDQTRKRDPNKKDEKPAIGQPVPGVKVLPAIRPVALPAAPAVIKRVQIAPAAPVLPAKQVEEKPAKEEKK